MPKINVLEKHVAELIAAGEVIERPASIVKELIENSIDAGATAVTVEIKNGGIKYIRITDNGCGIAYEDVPTAFLRHATSKVRYEYDLDSIGTLGFRGEALASVSAVAKVEMLTKTSDSQFGTRIELAGGEQLSLSEAGCPDGTTIVVRDLFYNVPARLKFLKRDISEAGAVSGIVDKIALSNPRVSIKFIKEGKVELHTPGDGNVLSAVYAVFGKEFARTLMPVDYTYQGVQISGFVSIPDLSKANRKSQHFFVNNRYIKSRTCAGALEEAYRHSIMVGKFPACVLYLQVPNNAVDVNVHPAKTEVRFMNEKLVYDAVFFAVKSAISGYNQQLLQEKTATEAVLQLEKTSSVPHLDYITKAKETSYHGEQTVLASSQPKTDTLRIGSYSIQLETDVPASYVADHNIPEYHAVEKQPEDLQQSDFRHLDLSKISAVPPETADTHEESKTVLVREETPTAESTPSDVVSNVPEETPAVSEDVSEKETIEKIRLCGELFKTYILAEIDNNFVMVDKHAAHERILYEKLKASCGEIEGQLLLTPLTLTFSREDYFALINSRKEIRKYGFEIEDFGQCTVQVREIPIFLDTRDATQVLYELGCNLRKNKRDITPELIDDMLHSIACKAAIKANDSSSDQELLAIVREVYTNENIRYCPHGRPVVIVTSKYELEKKFHRIV